MTCYGFSVHLLNQVFVDSKKTEEAKDFVPSVFDLFWFYSECVFQQAGNLMVFKSATNNVQSPVNQDAAR